MRSWRAIAGTIFDPVATFRALAEAPRSLLVLAVIIAANLSMPLMLVGKLDARHETLMEQGPHLADMTDRDIDEAVTQKTKLTLVIEFAKAIAKPPFLALLFTIVLWLWGRYLRGKPTFGSLFSLAAHAQIPLALRSLARAAVVASRPSLEPHELEQLVSSSVAPLFHVGPALARALGGADLFLVWTTALLAVALHASGKLPALRAAIGMAVAYAAFVAVFLVALPAMGGA